MKTKQIFFACILFQAFLMQAMTEPAQESPLSVQPGPQQQKIVKVTTATTAPVTVTDTGIIHPPGPQEPASAQTPNIVTESPVPGTPMEAARQAEATAPSPSSPPTTLPTPSPTAAMSGETPVSTPAETATVAAKIPSTEAIVAPAPPPSVPSTTTEMQTTVQAVGAPTAPLAPQAQTVVGPHEPTVPPVSPVTATVPMAGAPHMEAAQPAVTTGTIPSETKSTMGGEVHPGHVAPETPSVKPTAAPTPFPGTVTTPEIPIPEKAVAPAPRVITVPLEARAITPEEKKDALSAWERQSKQAHTAYLQWKINDPHTTLDPHIIKILTKPAQQFLINNTVLSFAHPLSEQSLDDKVQNVVKTFLKKFDPQGKKKVNPREMTTLVSELVKPEWIFWVPESSLYPSERTYIDFMNMLNEELTPVTTTLKVWALRFLTSESLLIALPIVQSVSVEGKSFNQLTTVEQKKALIPAIDIVTERFLSNMRALRQKYNLPFSGLVDEAIKEKITRFLHYKFVAMPD